MATLTRSSDYHCQNTYKTAGDRCLAKDQTFSSVPSRVSLGVRAYPWLASWAEGLALQASVDIGTGATSNFVEEVAPEAPYSVYLGMGYAFDTQPRIQRVVQTKLVPAAAPATKPQRQFFVYGTVVDAETAQPVKAAGVYFEGSDQNAMLTASNGSFRTAPLAPGEYRFVIRTDDYREGQCQALITDVPPTKTPQAPAPAPNGPGEVTEIKCELTALPRVATVTGTVRSADTTEFVNNATVVAKDDRGRNAAVHTDADGRFRFENVPAGKVRLEASADGFMSSVTEIEVQARVPSTFLLLLNKRPAQANVVVTKNELKLKRQVHFLFDSSEIQPDSAAILEEIADVLRQHTEIGFIEVQGHTDDVGSPEHNLRLSEDRASAVRDALQRLGVDSNRLSARGYGKQKPLVPNTNPQNRAKNRRVQLMIQNP